MNVTTRGRRYTDSQLRLASLPKFFRQFNSKLRSIETLKRTPYLKRIEHHDTLSEQLVSFSLIHHASRPVHVGSARAPGPFAAHNFVGRSPFSHNDDNSDRCRVPFQPLLLLVHTHVHHHASAIHDAEPNPQGGRTVAQEAAPRGVAGAVGRPAARDERRVSEGRHHQAQEAQLGPAQDGKSQAQLRACHQRLHPRRGPQCPAAQCGAGARREESGLSRCAVSSCPRGF